MQSRKRKLTACSEKGKGKSEASSSSSLQKIPRICIILPLDEDPNDFECLLYVINFNGKESGVETKIHIKGGFFSSSAFCIIGQTLFVFRGHAHAEGARGKGIYKYVFDGSESSLTKRMLTKCGKMKSIKLIAFAIPTPSNDKIAVFSSSIEDFPAGRSDFELFDYNSGKCRRLPQLCILENIRSFMIDHCCFINGSVMLVEAENRMFVVDTDKEGQTWKWYDFCIPGLQPMRMPFVLLGDSHVGEGVCMTPFSVFDYGTGRCSWNMIYVYPKASLSPDTKGGIYDIIPLDVTDPSSSTFCRVNVRLEEEDEDDEDSEWIPMVSVDVYEINVVECQKEFIKMRLHSPPRDATLTLPHTNCITSIECPLQRQEANCFYVRHCSVIPYPTA